SLRERVGVRASTENALTQAYAAPLPKGEGAQGAPHWLGTFHSIGVRLIRRHAEKLGLTPAFTILDTDDQLRLLKTILQELKIDEKELPPKLFSAVIQRWKDQALTPPSLTAGDDLQAVGGYASRV